jgi:hypothetical protein
MAEGFRYYSDEWRTRVFQCRCGWSGTVEEMCRNMHEAVMDFECPAAQCDSMLVIVSYPTREETLKAAEAGNAEAIREAAKWT